MESVSRGLKPDFLTDWNVRAKARTYLRGQSNGNLHQA